MLNQRQRKFAEIFVACGNASEAARQAGYSHKTAASIAEENLRKPDIAEYIRQLSEPKEKERVANLEEVIQFYSAVMRGQIKDSNSRPASVSDRLKAADSLMKRYAAGQEKQQAALDKLDSLMQEMKNAALDT